MVWEILNESWMMRSVIPSEKGSALSDELVRIACMPGVVVYPDLELSSFNHCAPDLEPELLFSVDLELNNPSLRYHGGFLQEEQDAIIHSFV